MGLRHLCVEGDCSDVVQATFGAEICRKELELIIFDIRYLLWRHPNWSVVHVSRNCYQVVHALAKLALKLLQDKIWVQTYPAQVESLVRKDVFTSIS